MPVEAPDKLILLSVGEQPEEKFWRILNGKFIE
jgi:hypothetical protein